RHVSAAEALWAHHHAEWRDPLGVVAQWQPADTDAGLLAYAVRGKWWEALEATGRTLLIGREYEHLLLAASVADGKRRLTHLRLPHPSGIAVDETRGRVFVAATRNPNMVYEFAPCRDFVTRAGARDISDPTPVLLPTGCRFLPGSLYLHDLAMIG